MHEDIERFTREGLILKDNKDFMRIKQTHIDYLKDEMRLAGVMPHMDIDPHWSTLYDAEKDVYICTLTLYGVFVGEETCPPDHEYSRGKAVKYR